MMRACLATLVCLVTVMPQVAAQTQRPTPAPEPPQRTEPRAEGGPAGQPVNVRFDITIVDEGGPQESRKAVSLTTADRQSGQVRAVVSVPGIGDVPIALDAFPMIERDKIRARITLEYRPSPTADPKDPQRIPASMRLAFGILLENGRKIVAAQAADPVTDRRVSVEVTATVLK